MAKDFKTKNPLDKLSGTPGDKGMADDASGNKEQVKKRPGRPRTRTEETRTINIAIPVSVLEKMNIAKVCYGNNLTGYINRLIEKDMKVNYEEYIKINNSLDNIK